MTAEAHTIPDKFLKAADKAATSCFSGTSIRSRQGKLAIAKAINDAVMAERERFSRATPAMIAAAWATWKLRNPKSLGPGPGFVEAINAALAAAPKEEG